MREAFRGLALTLPSPASGRGEKRTANPVSVHPRNRDVKPARHTPFGARMGPIGGWHDFGMKPALQIRLNQQLALTPQLQQAIRLLQLSSMEIGRASCRERV